MTDFKKDPPRLGIYNERCIEQCLAIALERLKPLLWDDSKRVSGNAESATCAILYAWDLIPSERPLHDTIFELEKEKKLKQFEEIIQDISSHRFEFNLKEEDK